MTDGVVVYCEPMSGVLLIVPIQQGESGVDSPTLDLTTRMCMVTQKVRTWDTLQEHPIAKELDADTKLALLCEFIDLYDELQGMTLADFVDGYFAAEEQVERRPMPQTRPRSKMKRTEESNNGDVVAAEAEDEDAEVPRPASMVGMRVVYRFPGRNVLSDEKASLATPAVPSHLHDVDGEPWSNVAREQGLPDQSRRYYHVIHVIPREAKEMIAGWLAARPRRISPRVRCSATCSSSLPTFPIRSPSRS